MSTWTDEKHEAARKALEEDMSQWGTEYGDAALDEIERLRALTTITDDMVERARKRLLMYLVTVHRMSPEGAVEMADDMALDVLEAALQPTARDKTGEDALTIATALEAALTPKENEA